MVDLKVKMPKNLKELEGFLAEADKQTYLLAGGTDFIIKLKNRNLYEGTIIDLSGIRELRYIIKEDEYIKIGSNSTFTDIEEDYFIRKFASCVGEAAKQVGSKQIRNTATMAGNIANASPAADSIPALIALDSKVKILNGKGEISVRDIDEVVEGLGKNKLNKDEVIMEILIPIKSDKYKSSFVKLGSRSTVTISKLSIAVSLKYTEIIEDVKVVIGAIGPIAFESKIAEMVLEGKKPSLKLLDEFESVLQRQVDMAIAGRSSQAYKRECIRGIAIDIFNNIFNGEYLD